MKKNRLFIAIAAATLLVVGALPAMAVPQLQLYIDGATYDTASETWVTTSDTFTLGAYMVEGTGKVANWTTRLGDTYYLTMAFLGTPGTFDINGAPVSGTLNYGTPPADGDGQGGMLPAHGIFPAYYYQQAFTFDAASQVAKTDLTNGFSGPVPGGEGMYQKLFTFDISGLDAGLHFDLFNTVANVGVDVQKFAPFSHDAEGKKVPEPGTMVLFGAGLAGLAAWGRKRRSA